MKEVRHAFALFTDVSASPVRKLGVGSYLVIPASLLEAPRKPSSRPEVGRVKVRRFEGTSSTRLELEAVIWALEENRRRPYGSLTIYTDSQCTANLLRRKPRLLAAGFLSKKTNQPLGNASLYRLFYEFHDELGFHLVKVKGHSRSRARDHVHRIFSFVDKEARNALKIWLNELADSPTETSGGAWCVYVLRCRNDSLYIGMTNNLGKRLERHTLGTGSKFVRSWRPFELVKTIPCKNAGEARRIESELKRLPRGKKIKVLFAES